MLAVDGNVTAVVDPRDEPRQPVAREIGIAAQGGDRAVSHGRGTQRAALHLRLHQIACGARHVRAGDGAAALARPWGAVIAACRDALHERMPGRMKFERIDALAAHVEGLQHGRVAIGEPSVLEVCGGPDGRTVARELRGVGRRPLARHGLLQRLIGREQVVIARAAGSGWEPPVARRLRTGSRHSRGIGHEASDMTASRWGTLGPKSSSRHNIRLTAAPAERTAHWVGAACPARL